MNAGPGGHRGEFAAWDIQNGRKVWAIKERFPVWSGAVATAGDVVFYGTMEGWFKAVHARPARCCGSSRPAPGSSASRPPIAARTASNMSPILSGVGGWSGAIVSGDLDPRDGTAALGFVNAMRDLPDVTTKGGTLYVFRSRRWRLLVAWRCAARVRPVPHAARAPRLRRSQQPAVLQRPRRRVREQDRRAASRGISTRR